MNAIDLLNQFAVNDAFDSLVDEYTVKTLSQWRKEHPDKNDEQLYVFVMEDMGFAQGENGWKHTEVTALIAPENLEGAARFLTRAALRRALKNKMF